MPLHVAARPLATLSVACLVAAGATALPSPAHAVDLTSAVVISEVYGGGGNSGAQYQNDFIELYNHGTVTASVAGWSVQYASAAGRSWVATPLTGSVPAGGFYLVAEGAGAGNGGPLPTANATGTTALSASNGKVALVNSATALTGCAAACDSAAGVVDFLGFGTANDAAGTATPALTNTTSDQRTITPFTNTGNNATDFSASAPTPAAAGTTPPAPTDCSTIPTPAQCVPGTTTIQDVQGDGFVSPLNGSIVSKVAGVVTATRKTGSSQGFWIQEPSPTADASASSGVFVFTKTATVAVGDSVLVTGKVSDFYAAGPPTPSVSDLSVTEIAPTTVTTLSAGNPLPATVLLSPATVPSLYAPSPADGNVESIATVDPTHSVLEFFEAHEGMLVEVDNARVIGPADKFGELYVTDKPGEQVTPRGGSYIAGYDSPPTGRLLCSRSAVSSRLPTPVTSWSARPPARWSGRSSAATTSPPQPLVRTRTTAWSRPRRRRRRRTSWPSRRTTSRTSHRPTRRQSSTGWPQASSTT